MMSDNNFQSTNPGRIVLDCWGTCVTRDIFGMVDNDKFVVNKFHQLPFLTTFLSVSNNLQKLSFDELSSRPNEGRCWYKWALCDLNREEVEILENSGSEWIVIDLRFLAYNYREVKAEGQSYYFYHRCTDEELRKIFEKSGIKIDSINTVGIESIPRIDLALDRFYEFLKKRYKNNIILIETREALWKLDKNGSTELLDSAGVERWIRIEEKYFAQALRQLDCFYVKTPQNIIRDDYHKWGIDGVHYVQEYYDYANRCMDIITSNSDDYLKKIDRLFIDCTQTFDLIRSKIMLSRVNTIRQIEDSWKVAETPEEINNVIDKSKQIIEKSDDVALQAEL